MLEAQAVPAAVELLSECRDVTRQLGGSESRKACERLDRHFQWLETRLKSVCTEAGERILRTVADVEGVYVKAPPRDADEPFGRFHENEYLPHAWMSPRTGRHYSLLERDALRAPGKIDQRRYEIVPQGRGPAKVNEPYQQIERPSAKYSVSWRTLGERADRTRGLYGDETTVFEVATGQVLAVRRFYYYAVQPHVVDEEGRALWSPNWRSRIPEFVKPCGNYRPREDHGYIDLRPRDSYEFVSRVLKPKVISDEAALGIFDLAHGSGRKEGGCMVASFGPRISPENVEFVRMDDHGLKIAVRGTGDSLYCPTFYQPGGYAKKALYRFYDGRVWSSAEIDKAASANPRMLTPVRPVTAPQAPGEPPDLRFNVLATPPSARQLLSDCRDTPEQPAGSPKRLDCERLDGHIRRSEARLAELCTDAGERIRRTVTDVEGVFVKEPPPGTGNEMFHSEDGQWDKYMDPVRGRHYTLWESNRLGGGGKIRQVRSVMTPQGKARPLLSFPQQYLERPTARYGVTWRAIGDIKERAQGVYGDETIVFEVATGDVLAVRRVYYYVLRPGLMDAGGQPLQLLRWSAGGTPNFVQMCRNYRLKENRIHTDFQPRDSYEFVARVLEPKPVADELAVGLFTLARGAGTVSRGCAFVTFGPRIAPQDLDVRYIEHNSIRIAIRGTRDALLCSGFYTPAGRQVAHQAQFRFYDGTSWTFEDIDRRTNLRARVLAATEAASGARAAPPVASAVPVLPTVERGLWKLKSNTNGTPALEDYCGDPLENIGVETSRIRAMESLGCRVQSTSSSSRTISMVIQCPDAVSKNGSMRVREGRTELRLASPSPTSFSLQYRRVQDGFHQTIEGKRVGGCM